MANHKSRRKTKGDRVSRVQVREEIQKAQEILIEKIEDLNPQRAFARRVLDQSNNVISYFLPIYDSKKKIIDFRIEYVNERMEEVTDEDLLDIIGAKMSDYYPANFENGVFEELIQCFESEEQREFEKKYTFGDTDYWFFTRVVKLDDGILLFSKNISKEKEIEIELDVQNKLLTEAEYVANIGSYKWNLHEENIKYSDNAFRLFGYEPGDFEPSVKNFMSFVHPDDLPPLKANYENVMQRKERTEALYRVITKDKKIKNIRSIGEFYKKGNNWYMVGVLVDVSKEIANEERLRRRNIELNRTNEELESFNRIASHDLQEPLRKIQMFISRLEAEEKKNFSERSKGYMEKVVSSVDRMRELISNLLSYSRIEAPSQHPQKIDLNMVLAQVKEDLSEQIEESNAEIKAEKLPKIIGIAFQIEQLFGNIIGNSLKYRKPDVAPKIEISSEILPFSKIDKSLNLPKSRYVEIQLKDNGIGFDKKHSDKIFEIFQRLHNKKTYSGTGLGLAICRKIVEAHHGAIKAKGSLSKGSVFTIYLPYSA